MVTISYEVVELSQTDVMLPRVCARCMDKNPSKSYETKKKTLASSVWIPGGRRETWATYSLKPSLCASCDEKLFGTKRKVRLALVASIVVTVGIVSWMLWNPGFWETSLGLWPSLMLMVGSIMFCAVLALMETLSSPTLPVALEVISPTTRRLVFEDEALARAFLELNPGKYSSISTRTAKTREMAVNVAVGAVLVLMGIEATRALLWLQGGAGGTEWYWEWGIGLGVAILELPFLLSTFLLRKRLRPNTLLLLLLYCTMLAPIVLVVFGVLGGIWDVPGVLLGVVSFVASFFSLEISENPSRLQIPSPPRDD